MANELPEKHIDNLGRSFHRVLEELAQEARPAYGLSEGINEVIGLSKDEANDIKKRLGVDIAGRLEGAHWRIHPDAWPDQFAQHMANELAAIAKDIEDIANAKGVRDSYKGIVGKMRNVAKTISEDAKTREEQRRDRHRFYRLVINNAAERIQQWKHSRNWWVEKNAWLADWIYLRILHVGILQKALPRIFRRTLGRFPLFAALAAWLFQHVSLRVAIPVIAGLFGCFVHIPLWLAGLTVALLALPKRSKTLLIYAGLITGFAWKVGSITKISFIAALLAKTGVIASVTSVALALIPALIAVGLTAPWIWNTEVGKIRLLCVFSFMHEFTYETTLKELVEGRYEGKKLEEMFLEEFSKAMGLAVLMRRLTVGEFERFRRRAEAAFRISPKFAFRVPLDTITDEHSWVERLELPSSRWYRAPIPYQQLAYHLLRDIPRNDSMVQPRALIATGALLSSCDIQALVDFLA